MIKSRWWILILAILFIISGIVLYAISYKEVPYEKEKECFVDSDCVPDSCCHSKTCVAEINRPNCGKIFCTQECAPGTLDCNQGSCKCIEGKCGAILR